MKIGMILNTSFPPDIRVEKEARSLQEASFDVFILCRLSRNQSPLEEWKYATIIRSELNTFNRYWGFISNNLRNIHPFWIKQISWFIKEYDIDVLHVHDLPLVKPALIAANGSLPVIADLHEVFPAALQEWVKSEKLFKKAFYKYILFNYNRWKKFEKKALNAVSKIITVTDEAKEKIQNDYSISSKKVTVISNFEPKDSIFSHQDIDSCAEWKYIKERFTIFYVGGFGAHRGLDTTIKALNLLKDKIPDLYFIIAGKGSAHYTKYLQYLVQECELDQIVHFTGWIPFESVPCIVNLSKLGLIPHNYNEFTDNTIPHKLFQFMIAGKSVIVSSCRPLKRVIEDCNAGKVFEADDPASLADKIFELYCDPELLRKLGENGRIAVMQGNYNWEYHAKRLVELYKSLIDSAEN